MELNLLALSSGHLLGLLPLTQIVAVVEDTARALADGVCTAYPRQHLSWSDNTLLSMPALSQSALGVKLVTVMPGNAALGHPVTHGLMVLLDLHSGRPIALLDGAALTALRTGAVGALGIKHLTPPDLASVGIIGCGVQGTWQAIFACSVRPIREIHCLYRSERSFERFSTTVQRRAPHIRIVACRHAHELAAASELIIAATTSRHPVLPEDPSALIGKHFISVGSFRPDMQELPLDAYRLAGSIVVDSPAAVHEAGDVIRSLAQGAVSSADVVYIGDVITARRRIDLTRTTAYKTVGLSLYDLDVAHALYLEARRREIGHPITL